MSDPPRKTSFTAQELLDTEFAPPRDAVPGILSAGLTILSGKQKQGKSWLVLEACLGCGGLGQAWGLDTKVGPTLYLALEDGPHRLKARMLQLLGGRMPPQKLLIKTSWPRFDPEAKGLERLRKWLEANPGALLVVVDTWRKVRPPNPPRVSADQADYEGLAPLQALAIEFRVAIVVVMHNRKAKGEDFHDEIAATGGMAQAADNVIGFRRERGAADASLQGDGRDIDMFDLMLQWRKGGYGWSVLGDADEYRISQERQQVVDALTRRPNLKMRELYEELGMTTKEEHNRLRKRVWDMTRDGQLRVSESGRYQAAIQQKRALSVTAVTAVTEPTPVTGVTPVTTVTPVTAVTEIPLKGGVSAHSAAFGHTNPAAPSEPEALQGPPVTDVLLLGVGNRPVTKPPCKDCGGPIDKPHSSRCSACYARWSTP